MGIAVDHMPVLLTEVLDFLRVRKEGIYVDCTQGSGGHSEEVLSQLEGTGQLIALDRDQEALDRARERLGSHSKNLQVFHQNFKELPSLLSRLGIGAVDGCLLDLGVSSNQLDSPERGFSFRLEGPLDMRMDTRQETTAAQLLNECSAEELAEIFWRYGEEKAARRISTAIVEHRKSSKFYTTTDLAQIVEKVKGRRGRPRIHPSHSGVSGPAHRGQSGTGWTGGISETSHLFARPPGKTGGHFLSQPGGSNRQDGFSQRSRQVRLLSPSRVLHLS